MRRVSSILLTLVLAALMGPGRAPAASCPTSALFTPAENGSTADTGWMGTGHLRPISGNVLHLALGCAASSPPCGTCPIAGLLPDPEGRFQRCSNDTSLRCTVATEIGDCGGPGTCTLYLTAPQPVAVGGLGACYTNAITSAATGTVGVESGAVDVTVAYEGRLYLPEEHKRPCPTCDGDVVPNDNLRHGTCHGGARNGLACDGNAPAAPLYDDFGTSSFDCPPHAGALVATLSPGPVTFSTGTQTLTLTAASPDCTSAFGRKCFCDTCNSLAAEPCASDADCPPSGGNPGICGGRRCDAGPNVGSPCTSHSECPTSGCNVIGRLTEPNLCLDDTTTPADEEFECSDTGLVGDGLGECLNGPVDKLCSNHPNRSCASDADCDGVADACLLRNLSCFVTNGTAGQSIPAIGFATPPVANVAAPTTLGMITCQSSSRFATVDQSLGLPGLARNHHVGTLTFDPSELLLACPAVPDACRTPVTAGKSPLALKDRDPDAKDQLRWRWNKGAATTLPELGDPTTADAYALCVYDADGLRARMVVPAGGLCDGRPCWKATGKGFVYKRKDGSPHGITKLLLKSGDGGKTQMQANGRGGLLALPPLASLIAPLQVQLRNLSTGLCWSATYDAPFARLTTADLKATD